MSESSNQIQKIQDRSLGFSIKEGHATITGPLTALSTGYNGYVDIDLSSLNLGKQIPEVYAVYNLFESLGGGTSRIHFLTLPFTKWNTNGTIEEAAYTEVYYDYIASPGSPTSGTQFLRIKYYNRSSSSGVEFDYKVRGSDALNAESPYRP